MQTAIAIDIHFTLNTTAVRVLRTTGPRVMHSKTKYLLSVVACYYSIVRTHVRLQTAAVVPSSRLKCLPLNRYQRRDHVPRKLIDLKRRCSITYERRTITAPNYEAIHIKVTKNSSPLNNRRYLLFAIRCKVLISDSFLIYIYIYMRDLSLQTNIMTSINSITNQSSCEKGIGDYSRVIFRLVFCL